MSSEKFIPKKGQIVLFRGQPGTFKVLYVSDGGQTAEIQPFNLSNQELLGNIIKVTHCKELVIGSRILPESWVADFG